MDKLTKAGIAHYMQHHVIRTGHSIGQVKDKSAGVDRVGQGPVIVPHSLLLLIFQHLSL